MRQVCDEFIALVWCLLKWEERKEYPTAIEVDCIDDLIKGPKLAVHSVFANHIEFLKVLNEISNAYKHSFINSDNTTIGTDERCVLVLALHRNKLASGEKFYSITERFDGFYQNAMARLRSFSERYR